MKSSQPKIHVFGCGFKPFSPEELNLLRGLKRIYLFKGTLRNLSKKEIYSEILRELGERLVLVENKRELMARIEEELLAPDDRGVGVLATGDPLFYGIAEELKSVVPEENLLIYPDLSSLQILCARLKISPSCVRSLSFHGRPFMIESLLREVMENPYVAVFTDAKNSPDKISLALLKRGFERLLIYVGERLGSPDEEIYRGSPREISERTFREPNLMLIENACWGRSAVFGRKIEDFEHKEGLITKDEIRAIVIYRLSPPKRGIIWDIGAGSGSVSIELATLSKDLEIFAIERDPEQVKLIERNRESFLAPNVRIIYGEAPSALEGLPKPDRVFLGGSGGKLQEILEFICNVAKPEVLVATFVILDHLQTALRYLKNCGDIEVTQIQVNRGRSLGENLYLKSENPVFILRTRFSV